MRTEIIYGLWYRDDDLRLRLEADDESSGEALRMAGDSLLGDAGGAVAVVGDTPVEVGKNCGVDAADPAIVRACGVFSAAARTAVGGESAEKFDVGFEREERSVKGYSWSEEPAVDVVGEIAACID